MLELRSSNPVIADDQLVAASHARPVAQVATIPGIVQKTAIAASLAVAGGFGGAALVRAMGPGAVWGIFIGSLVVSLVTFFALWRKPERAAWAAPLYSVAQGATLGVMALLLNEVLASRDIKVLGGLGVQAFVITMAVTAGMLIAYRAGLIRPNGTFRAVMGTLVIGIPHRDLLIGFGDADAEFAQAVAQQIQLDALASSVRVTEQLFSLQRARLIPYESH